MATKSVFKNIDLRGKKLVERFVSALEHATGKKGKTVTQTRQMTEVVGDDIKKLFRDSK